MKEDYRAFLVSACNVDDTLREAFEAGYLAGQASAQAEINEQCRLNGMGSEREARLMARVGELERERDALRERLCAHEAAVQMINAEWRDYLKEDETPIARLKREIADNHAILGLLAEEKRKTEALKAQAGEPWRDHVEQRLLTWKQSFVNRHGDQLALDDFMDKRSIDDLIDYVCDEYTTPSTPAAEPDQVAFWKNCTGNAMKIIAERNKTIEELTAPEPIACMVKGRLLSYKDNTVPDDCLLYLLPPDGAQIAELQEKINALTQQDARSFIQATNKIAELESALADRVRVIEMHLEDKRKLVRALNDVLATHDYHTDDGAEASDRACAILEALK